MPEYQGLKGNLSFKFKNRMNYLRQILQSEPFSGYKDVAEAFLIRLERQYELRNIVAHAHMQVLPDWGVTFTDYTPQKNNEIAKRQRRFALAELERLAWRMAKLSRLCQLLLNQLEQRVELPNLIDAE